jgi:hypothetical protein
MNEAGLRAPPRPPGLAGMRSRVGFSTCKGVAYAVRDLPGALLQRFLYHSDLVKQGSPLTFGSPHRHLDREHIMYQECIATPKFNLGTPVQVAGPLRKFADRIEQLTTIEAPKSSHQFRPKVFSSSSAKSLFTIGHTLFSRIEQLIRELAADFREHAGCEQARHRLRRPRLLRCGGIGSSSSSNFVRSSWRSRSSFCCDYMRCSGYYTSRCRCPRGQEAACCLWKLIACDGEFNVVPQEGNELRIMVWRIHVREAMGSFVD